jgi:arylsulfatase A-like enzyme
MLHFQNHHSLTHRLWLLTCGSLIFLCLQPGCKCKDELITQKEKSGTPNVILIIGDDFGYDLAGYNGGTSYSTPNIDYLAQNGMTFQHMFSYPDGFPSRIAMYTGKYNFRNYKRWGYIDQQEKMLGNMFKDAGYHTGFYGKWQCNGGDESLKAHGFDDYAVYLPFAEDQRERRYKNPLVYVDGAYLPDEEVRKKYSEDVFVEKLEQLIDRSVQAKQPFFAVYSLNLVGAPFVPTPDNLEFASWPVEKDQERSDLKYFPEMVRYVDKKVGQIREKVYQLGLLNNTLIIFTSDNNSDQRILSSWRGQTVKGTKTTTQFTGTNIPFIAYWPNTIKAGSANNDLHDFSDIFPTLADACQKQTALYGILDGVSFYKRMTGSVDDSIRSAVFVDWDNDRRDDNIVPMERYAHDSVYKLYDVYGERAGNFYNMRLDPLELNPLSESSLSEAEKAKKQALAAIISRLQ